MSKAIRYGKNVRYERMFIADEPITFLGEKPMTDFLLGDNRPATLSDIEQLLTAISTESFYVKSEEYRRIIGLGKTQFNYLRSWVVLRQARTKQRLEAGAF